MAILQQNTSEQKAETPAIQHTPGPLSIRRAKTTDNCGGFDWAIYDADGKIVGETFECVDWNHDHSGYQRRPAEANARLFAAAPDLLAACKAIVSESKCTCYAARLSLDTTTMPDCHFCIAKRAIEKAEARS